MTTARTIVAFVFGFIVGLAGADTVGAAVYVAGEQPRALTRAEVAPLLVDVYVAATGDEPPVPTCPFKDIDDVPRRKRDAICQLWGLGVVVGTERDETYAPDMPFATWSEYYLRNLADAIVRDR